MFVFNNLINNHFDETFKKDNQSPVELADMRLFLQGVADGITDKILSRLKEQRLKLFN